MNATQRDRTKSTRVALATPFVVVLALACATPVVPAVDDAERTLEDTANDPMVTQNAAVPFYEAQKTLAQAREARDEGRIEDAEHLAYLAQMRMEIAGVVARTAVARREVDQLRAERDAVRLSLRTREAEDARARARSAELEAQKLVRELEARRTERGLVITLDDVLFAFGQADLEPGARATLDRLAEVLRSSNQGVRIEGHTDSVGSQEFNQRLSRSRADAVRRYLVQRGVDPGRIEAVGLGQDYPVASNSTDAGRQRNRRVEIVIEDARAVGAGPP